MFFFVDHIRSQQCDAPGSALSCCLHNGNRCVDGTCENLLADTFCLKETAVAKDLIDLYMLLFHQNIKADFQGTKGSKQVDSHKVCQVEFCIRSTCKNRTALVEAGYMLTGEIVVGKESAAVCIALQGFVVQLAEQIVRADFHAEGLRKFTEEIDPCVQIGRTVLAVHHGNRMAGRSRYHIDLRIYFGEVLLQNDHGKDGSSGRYITRADRHAVCRCHTGSGISLRRAERNTCFQISGHVEKCGTFFCQNTGIVTCGQNVRQNIECFP